MINNFIEDKTDYNLPKFLVKIRRRSANYENTEFQALKSLIISENHKRTPIPKIEISYQEFNSSCLTNKINNCKNFRPSTSPISVILKAEHPQTHSKKLKRSKLNNLPFRKKKLFGNMNDVVVNGNSVKHYD